MLQYGVFEDVLVSWLILVLAPMKTFLVFSSFSLICCLSRSSLVFPSDSCVEKKDVSAQLVFILPPKPSRSVGVEVRAQVHTRGRPSQVSCKKHHSFFELHMPQLCQFRQEVNDYKTEDVVDFQDNFLFFFEKKGCILF